MLNIKGGYKLTLEWIIKIYMMSGGITRCSLFEIYCGIQTKHLPKWANASDIHKLFRDYESYLYSEYGIPVNFIVKKEIGNSQLPHGRYLITDQVSILIERGFELFWSDEQMRSKALDPRKQPRPVRDVSMILLYKKQIPAETQTKALPNL